MYKIFIFVQTYYRGENMKRRLKKQVIYTLYALSFVAIIGAVYILEKISSPSILTPETNYVNDVIIEDKIPVVSTRDLISRPYLVEVEVARKYYDKDASEEDQKNSLIYYNNTYIPNSGVDYKSDEVFDVVSILDGKVTKVEENNLLGKIIEITHENNLISVYQSLSEVMVAEGDNVIQGQVIGKSGTNELDKDIGNHLHFELYVNGQVVDPTLYLNKELETSENKE